MEGQNKPQMTQTPPPPQHSATGFSIPSLSPSILNNTQQTQVNLPPSIDVDQSLCNAFFSLNLSQTTPTDRRKFLPSTLDGEFGGVGSLIAGEGFISPFRSNVGSVSLEESLRISNAVNNHQRYSGVGRTNPLTVDPHHHHQHQHQHQHLHHLHHYHHPLLPHNRDYLQGTSSSVFDQRFEFDLRSYLLAKEHLYSTQQLNHFNPRLSPNPNCSILDESVLLNKNYLRFNNSSLNLSNGNNGGVSNKLQNHQFLGFLSLNQLRGMIYHLAKDQNGCKLLQSKFENPKKEEIQFVLSEVMGSIADLMKDQFGNYLIQKLVSVCDDDQKGLILRELTESPIEIVLVSMNPHGTRAVQKLLENLKNPNQIMIVMRALHRGAARLANDPNGHHVIQHCLLHFDSDFNQPILDEIADNCFKVATDRSGCCVLQACMEHTSGRVRNRLIAEIMSNAIQLAEDPFGNYVLQHMVGLKLPELTALLVRHLQGNFASLSRNKYASNVVEKCLIESSPEISTQIVFELIGSPNPSLLLVDPYGNFVIQSALKVSKGIAQEYLRKLISRNVSSMQSNLYGKKILEKFEKRKSIHI